MHNVPYTLKIENKTISNEKIKIRPVCRIQVADAETKIRMISLHAQGLSPAGRLKPWKMHTLKLFFKKHKKMKKNTTCLHNTGCRLREQNQPCWSIETMHNQNAVLCTVHTIKNVDVCINVILEQFCCFYTSAIIINSAWASFSVVATTNYSKD